LLDSELDEQFDKLVEDIWGPRHRVASYTNSGYRWSCPAVYSDLSAGASESDVMSPADLPRIGRLKPRRYEAEPAVRLLYVDVFRGAGGEGLSDRESGPGERGQRDAPWPLQSLGRSKTSSRRTERDTKAGSNSVSDCLVARKMVDRGHDEQITSVRTAPCQNLVPVGVHSAALGAG